MLTRNLFKRLSTQFYISITVILGSLGFTPIQSALAQTQSTIELSQDSTSSSPRAIIEKFHFALLDTMKNAQSLGISGRYKKLTPEVATAYDLTRWIRLSSGRFWRKATDNQKQQLKTAFKEMSAATYASQFKSYSGESFKTIGERPGPQNSILVQTEIVRKKKKPVGLTYIVFKSGDQWRIVDILLDNKISQLAVRRSEYRSLLKRDGIDGLIAKLKQITNKILGG
jgi:phospholipid transport system substrate-binding protein